jgi:glycosyltransferase involved in cell wall biosynthesis
MTTRDGQRTLPRVLEAYGDLEPLEGGWRLLVVDNGSTDATGEILRSFAGKLPLTCVFEAQRGQNRARNTALGTIEGDLVVFTDDDAIPRRDWLAHLRRAADDHPDFAIFGGTILPRWESPPEDWILRWVPPGAGFALTDPVWEEGPIRSSWVFSPNMAIRASVFRDGHRFDERFGPREGSYPMGSETELTQRLTRGGLRAWHVKRAIVEHVIRPYQLTPKWLHGRAVRFGRGQYRLASRYQRPRAIFGVPAGPIRGVLSSAARLALAKWRRDPEATFRWRWTLGCSIGSALEAGAVQRERRFGRSSPLSTDRARQIVASGAPSPLLAEELHGEKQEE